MINDLRHAWRGLRRDRGFFIVAVMTLALGIGANLAVFSLVRAVYFSPLPFDEPGRLVTIFERRPTSGLAHLPVSGHEFVAWREEAGLFERVALMQFEGLNLTGRGEPETLDVLRVSADYFPVLGLRPMLGRTFVAGEDSGGADQAAVLSDALWRRRFAADSRIIGQTILLNGQRIAVVGVMPPLPPSLAPDLWLPLDVPSQARAVGRHNLNAIGRLRAGVTLAQAQSALDVVSARLARDNPDQNATHVAAITPLRESLVGEFRPAFLALLAAVGFVLLIACANVANLLLARGAGRERELAIRTALGADRFRIVRQLLAESLLLAAIGGAAALMLCAWIVDLAPRITAVQIPLVETARVDRYALLIGTVISAITGLLAGAGPALRCSFVRAGWIRDGSRAWDHPAQHRLRSALVACEVALTFVLLVGAGLMLNSFARLVAVNPGFVSDRVIVMPIDLPGSRYPGAEQRRTFYDRMIDAVRAVPGVESAGAVSHLPLGGADNWMMFSIVGQPPRPAGQALTAAVRVATPDYFRTLGIPLERGRVFTDADRRLSLPIIRWYPQQPAGPGADAPQPPPVAIVSAAAARQFWPGQDPIGQRIRVLFSPDVTIVGVVGDIRHNGLDARPTPHIYLSHNQEPWSSVSLVVRTTTGAAAPIPALRAAVRALDPELPVVTRTMDDVVARSIGRPRFYVLLVGVFASLALALALVGIFGVVSYVAAQRRREIGVRIALGARPGEVISLVIAQGMRPILMGIAAGVGGALVLTRFIQTLLYGVVPADPLTFGATVAAMSILGVGACWLPARRAAHLDPLVALRTD